MAIHYHSIVFLKKDCFISFKAGGGTNCSDRVAGFDLDVKTYWCHTLSLSVYVSLPSGRGGKQVYTAGLMMSIVPRSFITSIKEVSFSSLSAYLSAGLYKKKWISTNLGGIRMECGIRKKKISRRVILSRYQFFKGKTFAGRSNLISVKPSGKLQSKCQEKREAV